MSKTERFELRLTKDEKDTLTHLAKLAGLTVSAYVVSVAIGDAIGQQILKGFEKNNER